jgi:uncharacterized protein YaaN involved in tellurite resistance
MDEQKIVLTLDPNQETQTQTTTATEEVKEVNLDNIDTSMLSQEDLATVDEFAKKIDITDGTAIMSYGSASQSKISEFASSALEKVQTKDLGEIGDTISSLVVELKGFDISQEEEKGFFGLFKKAGNKFQEAKAKYDKVEINVDKIVKVLENHQITLLKDIALLDELYEQNELNKKELTMYILAGRKKLKIAQEEELPKLLEQAKQSGLAEDAQKANDYSNLINRFEKKLYDLELTRMISVQTSPQIRLIQNNDTIMAEKIQSTLVNTIPLWKSQMIIALGLSHSQEAIKAEEEVNEVTNSLLKKNAEALQQATIKTAEASEAGIVEIETLQTTNQSLIDTLDEVLRIQTEGRAKRQAAEAELVKLENELREKLVEIKQ